MNAFLEKLALHLYEKHGNMLGNHLLVFPNRRSGVFFRDYLTRFATRTFWLPEINTINGFMEKVSDMHYADPIDLNFELYRIYSGLVKNAEPYDEFYFWGEMMIRDFNDIDKYLVDAGDLFRNISDLKEIDNVFDYLSREQKALIQQFWSHFREKDLSHEQESFLGIWKLLPTLYDSFRKELASRKEGYEGMVYRQVAEMISKKEYPDFGDRKVIICGFNALSAAERELFRHLRDAGRGEFYWDYDRQYREEESAEAGRFLRRNLDEFPMDPDFPDDFINLGKKKSIRVHNLPSDVLQTKRLYHLLAERNFPSADNFNDTAIILGDEELLQPVLSSLPVTIPGLNITMGYPLKNTPVFSFTEHLLQLQRNFSSGAEKKPGFFYHRDVLSFLNHQYTRAVMGELANDKSKQIRNGNMVYVPAEQLSDNDFLSMVFRRVDVASGMVTYLSEILDLIDRTAFSGEQKR